MRRAISKVGGFTLVELQIALLIVALMVVLMSGALRLASKTWASVNKQQDSVEHRYLLAQYLRRHVSNARFMTVSTEKYGSVTGFFGDDEQINFVAPFPVFHQSGELYWWNLKLEWNDSSDHYDLVASYFPYDNTNQGGVGGNINIEDRSDINIETENSFLKFDNTGALYKENVLPSHIVIAQYVDNLSFEYFYRDEDGVQKWVDEWQPGDKTPLVIRIIMTSATEPGDSEQEIIYTTLPEILITPRFANQKLHLESFDGGR
jgi:general secretion pathway protein J